MPLVVARRRLGTTPSDAPERPWLILQIEEAARTELMPRYDGPVCGNVWHEPQPRPCVGAMREHAGVAWHGEPVNEFTRENCALMRVALATLLREHAAHDVAAVALDRLAGLWLEAGLPQRAEQVLTEQATRANAAAPRWSLWVAVADAYAASDRHDDERRCLMRALSLARSPAALAQVELRIGLRHLKAQDFPSALRTLASVAERLRANDTALPPGVTQSLAEILGVALARSQSEMGPWRPRETWEQLQRILPRDAAAAYDAVINEFVRVGRYDRALAGYEHRSPARGAVLSPAHAWMIAHERPRAESVARLSAWVLSTYDLQWTVGDTVFEIAARWHRESLDRSPCDAEGLRDAIQLYQAIMQSSQRAVTDRQRTAMDVRASRYHASAFCALRAIGGS